MSSSLYSHPQLGDRVNGVGAIDRFVRAGWETYEHVLSVYPTLAERGLVAHVLTLDLVNQAGGVIAQIPIAVYPWAKLPDAEADAQLVARKILVSLRRADPHTGWQTIYDPDGPVVIATADADFKV